MNLQALKANKKLLAIIVGVAILATTGLSAVYAASDTTNSTQPQIQGSINLQNMIQSSVTVKFSTAADTAAGAVTNGKVIGGFLTVKQGYVVYNFQVIDDKNMVYSVIVDPSNGSVLYTSQGHQSFGQFGMGHGEMRMHKFHGGFGNWQKQAPVPSGTTPSTTPSDFQE
jgi:uncharacterized membrane protein YkoI